MATPEFFARRIVVEQTSVIHQGIPFAWCQAKDFEPDLDRLEGAVVHLVERPLLRSDLPDLGPTLFEDNDCLELTLAALGGTTDCQKLRGWQCNFGRRALILMHEAVVGGSSYYFVTYLSRGALGTDLAREAREDYGNLKDLSVRFQRCLAPTAQEKFQVVEPIAFGISGEYKGGRFPFFTMPVVTGAEELKIDLYPYHLFGELARMPLFRYAYPVEPKTRYEDGIQVKKAEALAKRINRLAKQGRITKALLRDLEETAPAQWFIRQRDDLLTGNALVYLLSDGRFPSGFQINAGDWMGRFHKRGGFRSLALITVAGGYDGPFDDEGWIERMRAQEEPYYEYGGELRPQTFPPFHGVNLERYWTILEQARSLIDTNN